MSKKPIWIISVVAVVIILSGIFIFVGVSNGVFISEDNSSRSSIDTDEVVDFESCVKVVGQVQESYPRRCVWLNETFVEKIDPSLEPVGGSGDSSSSQRTMKIDVYFTSQDLLEENCGATAKVTRDVPFSSSVARVSLQELFKGPQPSEGGQLIGSFEGMQEGFKDIKLDSDGTLTIDFNNTVLDTSKSYYLGNYGSSCGSGSWQQIYQTMKQFPNVKYVVFSVEGDERKWADMISMMGCPVNESDFSNQEQFIQSNKQCGD